jgi:hypothetical protein
MNDPFFAIQILLKNSCFFHPPNFAKYNFIFCYWMFYPRTARHRKVQHLLASDAANAGGAAAFSIGDCNIILLIATVGHKADARLGGVVGNGICDYLLPGCVCCCI